MTPAVQSPQQRDERQLWVEQSHSDLYQLASAPGQQAAIGIVWIADEDKPGVAGRGDIADGGYIMSGERLGAGQFAVAWVLNASLVDAVIAGPRTEQQWDDYVRALDYRFTADDEALIDRVRGAAR